LFKTSKADDCRHPSCTEFGLAALLDDLGKGAYFMKSQVILKQDVLRLGLAGDKVDVNAGFARNYLIPKKLAEWATTANVHRWNLEKDSILKARERRKVTAKESAQKLESLECVVYARVGEENKLFGSVTSSQIAQALAKMGHKIDKKQIEIESPIKTAGVHTIQVKLHSEVKVPLKLIVENKAK
jgi:large subunit ribosomal protein L9